MWGFFTLLMTFAASRVNVATLGVFVGLTTLNFVQAVASFSGSGVLAFTHRRSVLSVGEG